MRSWEAAQDLLRDWEGRGTKKGLVSLKQAVDSFLEDAVARHLAEATVGKQKVLLTQLQTFADSVGLKYVSQVTSQDLLKFRAKWRDAPVTSAKKLERLRSFFRFCGALKWIEENPAAMLRTPKFQKRPTLPFTEEEWQATLAAVDRYPTRNSFGIDNRGRLRAFVLLLRYSGLRIRDAVCLRRDRLRQDKLMLYTQKTGEPVYVPLPPVVIDALALATGELFFWTGNGNPKSAVADWQRSLRRLFALAGVRNGHAHRFRDTFAVSLLERGVTLETVAILLGNTLRIAEKHYAPWVRSRQVALEEAVRRSWS